MKWLQHRVAVLPLAFVLSLYAAPAADTNAFPRLGSVVGLKFTSVDGREVDVRRWEGKVILVDFWATWCGPCLQTLPTIQGLYEKFHTNGFEVVGISFDKSKSALNSFTRKHGIPWPQYFDGLGEDNALAARLGVEGVPALWLIDRKGRLREMSGGENLGKKVERLMREK